MGGGKRFLYPKHVWAPTGGWWTNPPNWKTNTSIVFMGLSATLAIMWAFSAEREERMNYPRHWIPSMMWAKQFNDPNFKPPPRGDDF
ncbi:hypothetical protein IWQ62_001835 [Dispira parvispora]|uniref:Uncharacterized protein n=1 Tax=Dispira parvispora TaxID=1520584 RepID=A0A9W8ARP1_9FUNG|nr:hypothetical protein IWQ62_001835 [Dispira parvispora]